MDAFFQSLQVMGVGMVGIFVVVALIILSVTVLAKVTAPKKKD